MPAIKKLKPEQPIEEWAGQDPEEAFTLPSRYFYDASVFAAERENIFMHAWHMAGHMSEFSQPGDYTVTDIFEQSVVVARNRKGDITAFHNVCQHRGNRLLEARRGTTGGVVRCAYHSWCYEMDGSLRSAPRCERMKNFDLQQFGIPQVRLEELGGFLYFNLDAKAPSLAELFPGADEEMHRVFPNLAELRLVEEQDVIVPANWKVIMDNSIEGYHFKLSGPCHVDLAKLIDFSGYQLTKRDNWWTCAAPANLTVTQAYVNDEFGSEDIVLNISVQRGLHSMGYNQGRYMIDAQRSNESEHLVHHFHRLVYQGLHGAPEHV